MKVNKDTETGIVTYTMPNGKTFSAAFKNAPYCVACDGKHSDHIICHKVVDGNIGPLRRFNTNKIIDILRQ